MRNMALPRQAQKSINEEKPPENEHKEDSKDDYDTKLNEYEFNNI